MPIYSFPLSHRQCYSSGDDVQMISEVILSVIMNEIQTSIPPSSNIPLFYIFPVAALSLPAHDHPIRNRITRIYHQSELLTNYHHRRQFTIRQTVRGAQRGRRRRLPIVFHIFIRCVATWQEECALGHLIYFYGSYFGRLVARRRRSLGTKEPTE